MVASARGAETVLVPLAEPVTVKAGCLATVVSRGFSLEGEVGVGVSSAGEGVFVGAGALSGVFV